MKKLSKKIITVLLAITVFAGVLTGCATQKEDAKEGDDGKRKIIAATGGAPKPYIWQDEDGKLDGYDIAVVNEVFNRLPQYELEYQVTSDFFTAADAGYVQMVVQHLGTNEERREKYLFSDPYYFAEHGLLVKEGSDIDSWDDLAGHSTEVNSGSFNAILFEKWNAENPDKKIELIYTEDVNSTPMHVADGIIDFEFFDYISLVEQVEGQSVPGVKVIPMDNDTIPHKGTGFTYFVFPKGEEQLQQDFNEAFEAALKDGTIDRLSQQYLGDDFAPTLEEAIANR